MKIKKYSVLNIEELVEANQKQSKKSTKTKGKEAANRTATREQANNLMSK
jgi:hypothetical protein